MRIYHKLQYMSPYKIFLKYLSEVLLGQSVNRKGRSQRYDFHGKIVTNDLQWYP